MAVVDWEFGKSILEQGQVTHEDLQEKLLQMEMTLQNSSYGHEHTIMALQEAKGFVEQEELNMKLEIYKKNYFQARRFLQKFNPARLQTLETQLADQKARMFRSHTV